MIYVCERCLSRNILWHARKYLFWTRISYRCETCGYIGNHPIEIDDLCCDVVLKLNELGYKTAYSCEGHFQNKTNVRFPYIVFDKSCFPDQFEKDIIQEMISVLKTDVTYSKLLHERRKISFIPPDIVRTSSLSFNRWKTDLWESLTMYVYKFELFV